MRSKCVLRRFLLFLVAHTYLLFRPFSCTLPNPDALAFTWIMLQAVLGSANKTLLTSINKKKVKVAAGGSTSTVVTTKSATSSNASSNESGGEESK